MESIATTAATEQPKSWRAVYKVHPGADVFPLPEDDLRKLGEDIQVNGLKEPIVLCTDENEELVVLDGRNRLDAMELVGIEILENQSARNSPGGKPNVKDWGFSSKVFSTLYTKGVGSPYSYVISKNIRRRHLTKEQQADLIVQVLQSAETDIAKMVKSVKQDSRGRLQGSTKDRVKQKAVEEGNKHGISKRTNEPAIAKKKGPTKNKISDRPFSERMKGFLPEYRLREERHEEEMEKLRKEEKKLLAKQEKEGIKHGWTVQSAINQIGSAIYAEIDRAPDDKERFRLADELRKLAVRLQGQHRSKKTKARR